MGSSSTCLLQFCTSTSGIKPSFPRQSLNSQSAAIFCFSKDSESSYSLCTPPTCKVPYEAVYPSQQERLLRGSLMSMCNIAAELAKDVVQSTKRPSTKPAWEQRGEPWTAVPPSSVVYHGTRSAASQITDMLCR